MDEMTAQVRSYREAFVMKLTVRFNYEVRKF